MKVKEGIDLSAHRFKLEGKLDMLTGVHNILAFTLTNKEKIIDLFPEGKLLFECDHCNINIVAIVQTIEELISEAEKENNRVN